MSSVSGVIKSIQDIMRKDVGVDGDAQRISQLVWMFFLKIYDDREEELELMEDDFKSPLPDNLKWRNWAKDAECITGDELFEFVNNDLFPKLKKLTVPADDEKLTKRAKVVRTVFEDAYNYMKSGTLMRQVINKISEIDFNNTEDRHTFGNIYEQLLKDLQSAGNAGEFYTPRAVTSFIVDRVDPKLDESVLDPACGTGGFLTTAVEHKRANYVVNSVKDEEKLQASVFGVEKKAMPHMLCVTNMILHGIDTPENIRHGNTLEKPYRDYTEKDRKEVIITNPPFGGTEEDGIENNFPAKFRTRETADLFMLLIIRILKKEGRAAVVLPDGFLFGEGMKTRLKEHLLEECNLHTIVRLPKGVFSPYTSIKTNILFFTKGKPTEQIWYYEHPYPEGVKSYNKTKPMRFEEFKPEQEWWGDEADDFASRVENTQAWKVSVESIKEQGYNLDIKNPYEVEKVEHDPQELLVLYATQKASVASIQDEIKSVLEKAFDGENQRSSLILDNIDIWTSAVVINKSGGRGGTKKQEAYGIKKLRELILELAVRGKLVPQDERDESASVLLEKIVEEKERLITDGNIKKQKVLLEIIKEEEPFNLPNSWGWYRLGKLCTKLTDGSHNPPRNSGSGYPMLSSQNVNYGVIDFKNPSRYVLLKDFEKENKRTKIEFDDVLLTIVGSLGRSAVVPKDAPKFVLQRSVAVIQSLLDSKFLALQLIAPTCLNYYGTHGKGTAQKGIYLGKLSLMEIAVPPINEQKRIVKKVDELMALCDSLRLNLIEMQTTEVNLADSVAEMLVE